MSKRSKPAVLIVDDRLDEVRPRRTELANTVAVTMREPDEVTEADLNRAALVMIDYRLEEWPGRDLLQAPSLRPENGIALAGVLRSYLDKHYTGVPVAFALYSGRLDELATAGGAHSREHTIARLHNLEWVFSKTEVPPGVTFAQQVALLAHSVQQLPREWPRGVDGQLPRLLRRLLGLPGRGTWVDRAWEDVEQCHPPYRELASESHGLSLVRWLLHRILPYPCFLLDTRYLAARLRVSVASFREAISKDSLLRRRLKPVAYSGVLAGFLGPRWWRTGVESLVWTLTAGSPFDGDALRKAAAVKLSRRLEPVDVLEPVVTLDERLRPSDLLVDLGQCVELQPDDWPAYAERAWVPLADADADPSIAALVVSKDRDRIAAGTRPATAG